MEQAGANIAPFGGKKRRADLPLEHSPQKKGKSKGKGKGKGKDNGTGRCFQDSIEEGLSSTPPVVALCLVSLALIHVC